MKAFIYAQLNPVKTLRQLVNDRAFYRAGVIAALVLAWFR